MAQEELILTDDLLKDIENLEKGVKDFSKSLKELGIESKSLQKDLNKIGDVSGTVMKAFATGDIDKAINKISTASKLTVGWEKYLEKLGKGGVTEMKALGEVLEKIVNTMNNLKPNTAIEDTIEAQKKDLIAMQNVNGATITPIDPKKESWDFAKNALKENKKDAKSIAGLEEQINHLSIAQENLIGSGKRYEQTITKISDLIDKKKTKIQDLTRTTEKQNQIEEKARIQEEKAYQQRKKRILAERELVHKQINESYDGSLRFSDNAKSINDRAKAIENMRKAYNKLDPSVETNKVKMARLNLEIKKQESALRRLQGETAKTSNAMGQWASRLGALFGINAISNFVRKMVTVRGEFELQQKSLEVLLKSKSEANKLWEQTMQLAVKSPFQVGQLITYTKQLAAYQIETDKLFDTTKRLADLSAGLGVDMDRLILAYGQVRTAEYLRATEVRQFTEAGVPLLDALADRFSALEGKAVSVAEVMERITKRQVTFGDVEAVINQMTDLGGLFYNMQEEQSKTVKGMMSNLKDEISLMFNEIGESSEGTIKRSLQVVRWLVKNWEVFANILAAIVPLYGIHKLGQLRFNESLIALAHSYGVAGTAGRKYLKVSQLIELATKRLKKAFDLLKTALMKHPIIAIATLVVGGIVNAIFSIKNFNDTLNEITDNTITKIDELNNKKIDIIDTKDLDEKRKKLTELVNIAKNYQIEINFKINELSSSQINEKANEISNQIKVSLKAIEEFDKAVAEQEYETGGGWSGLGMFEEEMHEDVKDLRDDLLDLNTQMGKLPAIARTTGELFSKSFSEIVEQSGSAEEAIKKMRSELLILKQDGKIGIFDQMAMNKDLNDLDSSIKEFNREVDEIFDNLNEYGFENLTKEDKVRRLNLVINAKADWNDFEKDLAKAEAEKKYGIKLRLTLEESAQKKLQDGLNTLYTSMENATSANVKEVEKEFDATLKKIKERTESLYNLRKSNIIELIELEKKGGNGTLTKEEQKKLDLLRKENSEYIQQQKALDLLNDYKGDGFKQFLSDVKDGVLTNNNLLDEFYNMLLKIEGLTKAPKRESAYNILSKDVETIAQNLEIPKDQKWNFDGIVKEIKPVGVLVEAINNELSKGISHTEAILNLTNKYKEKVENSKSRYYLYEQNLPKVSNDEWVSARRDYNEDSAILKILIELAKQYNIETQKGSGSKAESLLSRRIELIKKMQSEYEKLNDYMSNTTALERVKDRFAEAAKELDIDISDIQFATPEDVEKAFRRIKTASKKEKAELEKTIGDIQLDLEIKDAEKKLDVLKSEIDNLFTQYDLTIELQKLDVPPQLMKDLFGLDSTSLSDIRKKIENELSIAKTQEGGNEKIVEALEADLKKVEEKEKQHLENRLKEYVKFTRNAMSENAKLKYEELKALADIENTFEEAKQGKTDDEKVRIEEAKQQAILGYQKQTTEKMQELQWQAFKNSDMFASIFNDLDTVSDLALSNMITQLENYKEEWSDLPINEMKEVINQIEKMQNAMNKRKALANPFKDTKVYSKQNVETAEHNISSATIENQELTQQIADLEVIIQLENEKKDATAQIIAFQEKYNTDLSIGASIIKAELEDYKKYNAEIIAQNKDIINKYELQKLKLQEQANIYKEIDSQAQKLYDAFKDLSEVLGADDDSAVAIFADMGMSMASTVLQTLALQAELQAATVAAGTFGAAMNTAMGIIGWIVMAVQLITAGLKAAFDFHDNSKQREIENLQEHIDSLAKSYEELSKAMDMAYSMDRMSNAYRMAQANIEAQKKAIKEQIELEKEKWNTDKEKVKEYEEQLEELDKQSEDLKQQLIDSMGGITDTSSKAREFVDAWIDAFKETGDGLSGLEENFDEFFDNLIREQISREVIGPITQGFADAVNEAITNNQGGSGEITQAEWRELQQLAEASKGQMNNAMQMYRQFFEESGAGLSGLQEGIKGITESQADIIASYLNSIRMFVSEKAVNVREIRNILLGVNGQLNPMLDELKRVARHTENIRDLLVRVSDTNTDTLKVSIYQ
jgi:hypothetical protein